MKDAYNRAVADVLARTQYGQRTETALAAGFVVSWSNSSREWWRGRSVRRGEQFLLDANQIVVYAKPRTADKIASHLPALPLDAYSHEAKERGPEQFLSNPATSRYIYSSRKNRSFPKGENVLTVVEEREGIPLAVVKGGKPAKGDTIWLGGAPFCVVRQESDVLVVRPGAWTDPHCASKETIRRHSKALYAVNPSESPSRLSGYRTTENPIEGLPQYSKGPIIQEGWLGQAPPSMMGRPAQQMPHSAPFPTFESPSFQQPMVYTAYHYAFRFPIFSLSTYTIPQNGHRDVFEGVQYEYTVIDNKNQYILVRPTVPWVGFIVAEDVKTGEGLGWLPITAWHQVSGAKQWLKKKLDNERGLQRKTFHLYKKSGRQLRRYFRNNPNPLKSFRR
jgi:hypothetical protein